MKEYTVELPDGTKKYVVEFTETANKACALKLFIKSLNFIKETEEFRTADLQRYLECGYGTVCKVLDALCSLCIIEKMDVPPVAGGRRYKSLIKGE